MTGTAFVNNFAPETVQLTNGKQVRFRFKKEVFTDPETVDELRFLQANGIHVFEAEQTSEETLEFERSEKARRDQDMLDEMTSEAVQRQLKAMEMDKAKIRAIQKAERKRRNQEDVKLKEAEAKATEERNFVKANAPRSDDSPRASKIKAKIVSIKRDFDAGKMTNEEWTRVDLMLRDALDEVEFGIAGVIVAGEELTSAELLLRLEELKRAA